MRSEVAIIKHSVAQRVGLASRVRGVRTNRRTIVICTSHHQLRLAIVTHEMSSTPMEQ